MSDELNFTIQETFDRQELLAEAMEIVRYADVELGPEAEAKDIDNRKAQAIEHLHKLGEEQASFSLKLDVRRLTRKDFEEQGIEPSRELKAKMKKNHFYQVGIPITLFPKSGWAFTRLECRVEFCPGETNVHQHPIIHDIFPDDVWADILSFEDHLVLGLDENLAFRAQVKELKGQWQHLSAAAQAKLAVQVGSGAKLVVGPFSYRIRRSNVRSRGRGNVECFWRLDGAEYIDEEDVRLRLVLMVPKDRLQPVNAIGELTAYHDFQLWSADVFKDWINDFGKAIKALFGAGIPLHPPPMKWSDITQ